MPAGDVCCRSVVRHRLTNEKFEQRKIHTKSDSAALKIDTFLHEIKARQRLVHTDKVTELVDYI